MMRKRAWTERFFICFLLLFLGVSYAHKPKVPQGEIGIRIKELKDGNPVVIGVVKGGPADLKGIRPGDVITHIDGVPTTQIPFQDIEGHYLNGDIGSKVELNIHRFDTPQALKFKITRWQAIKSSLKHPETTHPPSDKTKEEKDYKNKK